MLLRKLFISAVFLSVVPTSFSAWPDDAGFSEGELPREEAPKQTPLLLSVGSTPTESRYTSSRVDMREEIPFLFRKTRIYSGEFGVEKTFRGGLVFRNWQAGRVLKISFKNPTQAGRVYDALKSAAELDDLTIIFDNSRARWPIVTALVRGFVPTASTQDIYVLTRHGYKTLVSDLVHYLDDSEDPQMAGNLLVDGKIKHYSNGCENSLKL